MKVIKMLSEKIEDTLDLAECYVETAVEYKMDFPEVSKVMYDLSEKEMANITSLHAVVVKVIADYRKEKGEPPEPMMAVYDYLHKKHIEHAAKIKAMQMAYKEVER